jgi:hypothetical protein
MKRIVQGSLRALGYEINRYEPPSKVVELPSDLSDSDRAVLNQIAGCTMTSIERQIALVQAVRYLARRGIEGSVVECGVWRGGSSMAAALTLAQEGDATRHLYLYDTFEGMTAPTEADKTDDGTTAQAHLDRDVSKSSCWCVAGIEDVQQNMQSTGYDQNLIHLLKGPVEETIPAQSPKEPIALLRLDTDWYESTRHELIHLFPQLCEGGILIIDDYGHWAGARKAVDEYFADQPRRYYMHRIDYTGRLLMKQ